MLGYKFVKDDLTVQEILADSEASARMMADKYADYYRYPRDSISLERINTPKVGLFWRMFNPYQMIVGCLIGDGKNVYKVIRKTDKQITFDAFEKNNPENGLANNPRTIKIKHDSFGIDFVEINGSCFRRLEK